MPRTVLVNGGNRGTGLAVAQAFAAPGDRAVVPRPGGQIRALGDGQAVRARAAGVAAVPEVPAPAPVPAIEVVLVDSEDLVRRGFRQALAEAPDIAVVAEARVGEEALRLVQAHRPRVVVVDAGTGGAAFIRGLVAAGAAAGLGVIALTSVDLDDHLFGILTAGARGFLLKSVSQDELIYAVRAVAAGDAFICPAMTRRLIDRFEILPPFDENALPDALRSLSAREVQVLVGIATGRSNLEIARELYLTAATVKSHVSHILAKLRLPNRVHAALLAYRVGLVRPHLLAG